jgi:tRNA(Ile)-lysidine synthase
MLPQFQKFIDDNKLIKKGDRILLTVSGGIDSMVMAHLFLRMNYHFAIAHCNFSLRGEESDLDEQLVRDFAGIHGIPFFIARFQTSNYAEEHGLSIQMAARELRYAWFEEIRAKEKYDLIAVAHNLNDNIETLLINLTRGTGLAGLSGMKVISGRVIRPLLFATREEISNYQKQNSITFREDRSNAETKYTRNKIRHLVIPVLKEINPSVEYTLNNTAERISGINEIVGDCIGKIKEEITRISPDQISLNICKLETFHNNRSLLFEIFREYGVGSTQLDDLVKLIKGHTGSILMTPTHRLIRNRNEIIITEKLLSLKEDPSIFNDIESLRKFRVIESAESFEIPGAFKISKDPLTACLDMDYITFPLKIRKWIPGDSFIPLGMKKKKKLSDYFIDRKYSIPEKENKLILESDNKIVWILGDRPDDRFKISPATKKVLVIKLRPGSVYSPVDKEQIGE